MTVMDYRTRDGLAAYGFSIEPHPGAGWRVYIIFIPSCQGDKIPDLPYEAVDDKRGHYVNWPPKLGSLAEARTVAGIWAELAEQYRRTRERKALYIELIERYVQICEKRMAARRPQPEQRDCARNEVA